MCDENTVWFKRNQFSPNSQPREENSRWGLSDPLLDHNFDHDDNFDNVDHDDDDELAAAAGEETELGSNQVNCDILPTLPSPVIIIIIYFQLPKMKIGEKGQMSVTDWVVRIR